jgi:phage-related protein
MLESISFFVSNRGECPVEDFILSLSLKERAKIMAYLGELKVQGHNLRRPMADYLGDGIYELRPRGNRIFYFFFMRESAVLLHAIKKKTDKIPVKDLTICLKRKAHVENLGNIKNLDLI